MAELRQGVKFCLSLPWKRGFKKLTVGFISAAKVPEDAKKDATTR